MESVTIYYQYWYFFLQFNKFLACFTKDQRKNSLHEIVKLNFFLIGITCNTNQSFDWSSCLFHHLETIFHTKRSYNKLLDWSVLSFCFFVKNWFWFVFIDIHNISLRVLKRRLVLNLAPMNSLQFLFKQKENKIFVVLKWMLEEQIAKVVCRRI